MMDYLKVFLVGGVLCAIGEVLVLKTKLTPARILVGYVCVGVFCSAIGLYSPLVDFAGSGATVPLSGFGHMLAQGVKNAVDSVGLLGALRGGFEACACGISAAIFFGFLAALCFRSSPERIRKSNNFSIYKQNKK